jgi:hypothetical protein
MPKKINTSLKMLPNILYIQIQNSLINLKVSFRIFFVKFQNLTVANYIWLCLFIFFNIKLSLCLSFIIFNYLLIPELWSVKMNPILIFYLLFVSI